MVSLFSLGGESIIYSQVNKQKTYLGATRSFRLSTFLDFRLSTFRTRSFRLSTFDFSRLSTFRTRSFRLSTFDFSNSKFSTFDFRGRYFILRQIWGDYLGTQRKGGIFLGILGFFWNLVFSKNRNQGLGGGSELNVDSHKRLNSAAATSYCFFFPADSVLF